MAKYSDLEFHVAPEDQGQIVEYAYACDDGTVIRRITDASDGSVEYATARALIDDEGDYWNAPPRNRRWSQVE